MRKIKLISVTLLFLIATILAILEPELFNFKFLNITITIIGLLVAYVQILYKNSTLVFIWWRKFCSIFNRDTVVWESSSVYKTSEKIDINHLKEISRELLSLQDIQIKSNNPYANKIELLVEYKMVLHNIKLIFDEYDNYSKIIVKYNTSVSYPNSKEEFRKFMDLSEIVKSSSQKYIIIDELHEINIKFTKSNPFYKFIVNHIDESKRADFNLTFKEDSNTVHISNSKMKVQSKSIEYIKNVLKDYIVVS